MKRITVYFTFETLLGAEQFRCLLRDSHWLDPADAYEPDYEVVVQIDAGNYDLLGKLAELASDARACWPRSKA